MRVEPSGFRLELAEAPVRVDALNLDDATLCGVLDLANDSQFAIWEEHTEAKRVVLELSNKIAETNGATMHLVPFFSAGEGELERPRRAAKHSGSVLFLCYMVQW